MNGQNMMQQTKIQPIVDAIEKQNDPVAAITISVISALLFAGVVWALKKMKK